MELNKISLLLLGSFLLSACGSDSSSDNGAGINPVTSSVVSYEGTVTTTLPTDMSTAAAAGFTRYSEILVTPNPTSAKANVKLSSTPQLKLRIISTGDSSYDEKMIRAGNIMYHLLQNVDGSDYGADKSSIMQTMANREATLILTKDKDENEETTIKLYASAAIELDLLSEIITDAGIASNVRYDSLANFLADFSALSDDESEKIINELQKLNDNAAMPKWLVNSQSLQYRELTVEGDCHYMSNFASYCENLGVDSDRDAAFEEILHLVQAQGIAPNVETSAYQEAVRDRALSIYTGNAMHKVWNPTPEDWQDWESDDTNADVIGSTYSHEYLAAVFEAFMGMNGHKVSGLDGYTSTERSQIIINDPIGDNLVREMFAGDLQYTARIPTKGVVKYYTEASLFGIPTFKMYKSDEVGDEYTHKSQYLINAKLIGDENDHIDLIGNDKDNILEGNQGDNTIRAGAGEDTYIVTNTAYKTNNVETCQLKPTQSGGEFYVLLTCPNIGTDKLYDFEKIKFLDKELNSSD